MNLYWRTLLPCILLPRALASLEKAAMRSWLTFIGLRSSLQIQKSHLHRSKRLWNHTYSCCFSISSPLIVLSVRMIFFSCDPQQGSSVSCMGKACRIIKQNWLIYWESGSEVGGIIDAPQRSHWEIIEREQRAWSENNRGGSSLSWVWKTMSAIL